LLFTDPKPSEASTTSILVIITRYNLSLLF
jgi:hypothetical protein